MSTKAKWVNGVQTFYDGSTFETSVCMSGIAYADDFLGAGSVVIPAAASAESGADWVKKIVGAGPPTVAGVANAAGGKIACTLEASSQKQDAVLYWNDQKGISVLKGTIFEAIVDLTVLPSAAASQAVWGLASDWIDGPDNNTFYMGFGALANGAVLIRSYDGTTTVSAASGVTVLAGVEHIYRIDASVITDVKFYIDGAQVNTAGQVNWAATGASAVLQPYFAMYKASGTGVGTLGVQSVKIWNGR